VKFRSVLSFDEDCARYFGKIKAGLDKRGRSRNDLDLCVAAIAVRHRFVLVTGNVRHFQGILGLKVENWLSD
jgi:tRNA(fMet)-specific endonuclease VapC